MAARCRRCPPWRRCGGLERRPAIGAALLEMLVALAILVVALSLLVSFAADSVHGAHNAQARAKCAFLAAEALEHALLHRHNLPSLEERKVVDPQGRGAFVSRIEVKDVPNAPGLKLVRATTGWLPPGKGDALLYRQTLETYMAAPLKK